MKRDAKRKTSGKAKVSGRAEPSVEAETGRPKAKAKLSAAGKATKDAKVTTRRLTLIPSYRTAGTRYVWITIDDGPHPTHTKKFLNILAKHSIRAAFFVLGENVAKNPSLVKSAYDAGHRIGNHSYSHKKMTLLSESEIKKEIDDTHKLIKNYLGTDKMFRAPYGLHNALVDNLVSDSGYRMVGWNVDTRDWEENYKPDKWVKHGVDQIAAQDVSTVLVHDIHKTTADNFESFIEKIKALGDVVFDLPSA